MPSVCIPCAWPIGPTRPRATGHLFYPYLCRRGGSSPCRRCCASERLTECCWERVPPEGANAQWFSPNTSRVDHSSAPTPPPSDPSARSAHTPHTQQSPAAPPCVHSLPRATARNTQNHSVTDIIMSIFYCQNSKTQAADARNETKP